MAKRKKGTFENFRKAWVRYFGKPKKKLDIHFVKGAKNDFGKIYAFYYDYTKTPASFSMNDYFYSLKRKKYAK